MKSAFISSFTASNYFALIYLSNSFVCFMCYLHLSIFFVVCIQVRKTRGVDPSWTFGGIPPIVPSSVPFSFPLPLPFPLKPVRGWESAVSSPIGVRGRAPVANAIWFRAGKSHLAAAYLVIYFRWKWCILVHFGTCLIL